MDSESPLVQKKRRKFPFIFFMIIALLLGGSFVGIFSSSSETADLEETAEEYFETVKAREYTKAYYEFTSKDFQKRTSLDLFKKGIKGYTFFQRAGSLQFNKRNVTDQEGVLQGIVKSIDGYSAPITLFFVKEDGEWKLGNMEADLSVEAVSKHQLLEELIIPIVFQLELIRNGDLEKAYAEPTSESFRKANDFDHFKQVLAKFPLIGKSTEEEFIDAKTKEQGATLDLVLYAGDTSAQVIYELVKEQDDWKILSFQIVPL